MGVRNVLKALEENWFKSEDQVALKCAHLLKSALSEEINEVPHLTKCSPPSGLCMEAKDRDDQGLIQTLYMSWNGLGWTVAPQFKLADLDDRIKEARLIGPYGPIKSSTKVVKTADNHFVAISVHFGKLDGKLWLNDEVSQGVSYYGALSHLNQSSAETVEQYFDNVCHKFDSAMRYWG